MPMKYLQRLHLWITKNANAFSAYSSIVAIVSLPIIVLGGIAAYSNIKDMLTSPEVTLHFTGPKGLLFEVWNTSEKLAEDVRYQLTLYNFSIIDEDGKYENVSVPVDTIDFIRPGRGAGPWSIKDHAVNGQNIENGHHIFGHALVQCRKCERIPQYWIFVQMGQSGWHAPIALHEELDVWREFAEVLDRQDYLRAINKLVPKDRRYPIRKQGWSELYS